MKSVSFQEYVKEVLKGATYKKGRDLPCVVAVAPDLPGCLTQGDDFEEARENLIDAIQLWITSTLKDNERLPAVNGRVLTITTGVSTCPTSNGGLLNTFRYLRCPPYRQETSSRN